MTPDELAEHGFVPAREAVAAGRIPGAALGVITASGARAAVCDGLAQRQPVPAALERGSFFDLASLTKVILTVPAILRLLEAGSLDLDDPIARHLPDFFQYELAHKLRRITIRQCLTHQTGLPAVAPIYSWGSGAATLKALVLQKEWTLGEPVYSDINFILLGLLLERMHGRILAEFPLPAGFAVAPDPERAVATEFCQWRGRLLRGVVHDENAHALGGIAGHAGLFGTVDGVLDFAHGLLTATLLSEAACGLLRRPASATRTMGWQCPHQGWSGGSLCSPDTIGHTGFTGTGLWIDFSAGLAWTLLTNRVHPSRHVETGIAALRQAVGNRVSAAFRPIS